MPRVAGVKEKIHQPLYDAFVVAQGMPFGDARLLRFFVDVNGKSKLDTNLQAASTLPSLNTFEARAMRLVASPPAGGATSEAFLTALIYRSVISFLVGEKIMFEAPSWFTPGGAGVSADGPVATPIVNHGEPNPLATFKFSEGVWVEAQQPFRVELQFPGDVPADVQNAQGEMRLWVVLDGFLTRDVQ